MKKKFLKLSDVQKNVTKFEEISKDQLKEFKGGDSLILIPFIAGIPADIVVNVPIQTDLTEIIAGGTFGL